MQKQVLILRNPIIIGLVVLTMVAGFFWFSTRITEMVVSQLLSTSSDMTEIVFSKCKNNKCDLHIMKIDGGEVRLLAAAPKGLSYEGPVFSPDNQRIAFIVRPNTRYDYNHDKFGDIYIIDRDGKNIRQLTYPQQGVKNIREVVFSPDGKSVFFLNASVYENYSPFALPAPHGYDLYSISLNDPQFQRLTFESGYYLFNLAVAPSKDALLIDGITCAVSGGICLLPLDRLPLRPHESVTSFRIVDDIWNGLYSFVPWPAETAKPITYQKTNFYNVSSTDKRYQLSTVVQVEIGQLESVYSSDVYLFDNLKQNYINLTKKNFSNDSSFKLPYGIFLQKQERVIVIDPETREIWSVKYDGSGMQKIFPN